MSPLGKVLPLKNSRLNSNLGESGLNHPLERFWGLGQNVLKEAYVNLGLKVNFGFIFSCRIARMRAEFLFGFIST